MKEIVINPDHCSVIQSVPLKENSEFISLKRDNVVKATEFWEHVGALYSTGNEFLPSGTRFVETCINGSKMIVVEDPPAVRTISVMLNVQGDLLRLRKLGKLEEYGYSLDDYPGNGPHNFTLAFPYTVWIMNIPDDYSPNVAVFFRTSPVSCMSDYLCKANLFNISDNQWLCLGSSIDTNKHNSIIEKIDEVKNKFWFNTFNQDYIYNYKDYEKIPEVCDYLTWQHFSRIDPMFVYSVKWIPYKQTLGEFIKQYKNEMSYESKFTAVSNMFTKTDFFKTVPRLGNIYLNVCDSVIIDDPNGSIIASVGDDINIGDTKYYITSFIGSDDGMVIRSIEFETEEGNKIVKRYTLPVKKAIAKSLRADELKECEIRGNTVKAGDIISIKAELETLLDKRLLKIRRIRTARDGKFEVMCGDDFYLLENIDFEVVDINSIKLFGKTLDTDAILRMSKNTGAGTIPLPLISYVEAKFDSIDVINQRVIAKFLDVNAGTRFSINMENPEHKLVEDNFNVTSTNILRIFGGIATNKTVKGIETSIQYIKGHGVMNTASNLGYNHNGISELIMNADETEMHIPGIDFDINFKIGDTVVVADWGNPQEMIKIRRITHFDIGPYNIYIETEPLGGGETREDMYIDTDSGLINVGKIRKIGASFAGIKAGDKIQANEARIPHFPKKDFNTVVGFIYDTNTKYPLMLCSNCLTLWASPDVLSKFNVFKKTDGKYLKAKNAPILLKKTKIQRGDILSRSTSLCCISTVSGTTYTTYQSNRKGWHYNGRVSKDSIDDYYQRFGFLTPRLAAKDATSRVNVVRGFVNIHGGIIPDERADAYFKEVE